MAHIKLTPETEQLIVATIRAGAYPHIAAEAAGVPREVFRDWVQRGREFGRKPYGPFWQKVRQAKAHARLKAEMEAREKDAKFWLRYGPGKDRSDAPGWSLVRTGRSKVRKGKPLQDPAFGKLLSVMLEVLMPFPEARLALLGSLRGEEAEVSSSAGD